jgi:preprotein translocase subunit SecA
LEDDIMRLFGSERVMNMMEKLGVDEDTPIEQKMLTNAIENAQKQVESRNFQTRKNVLQYDDVMNTQRAVIYEQRSKVLEGADLQQSIQGMLQSTVERAIQGHIGEQKHMDKQTFQEAIAVFRTMFLAPGDLDPSDEELQQYDADGLTQLVLEKAQAVYQRKEQEFTPPLMRELERVIMLRVVDEYWMDHIDAMTELRQGIGLRAYAQTDPVVAYKTEGYEMFEEMIAAIQEETLRRLFLVRIKRNTPEAQPEIKRERVAKITGESSGGDGSVQKQPTKKVIKIGRNDPCPCGSGLKWKKCTCAQYHPDQQS